MHSGLLFGVYRIGSDRLLQEAIGNIRSYRSYRSYRNYRSYRHYRSHRSYRSYSSYRSYRSYSSYRSYRSYSSYNAIINDRENYRENRKLLILLTLYVSYGYIYPPKFLRKKIAIYLISPHEFIIFAANFQRSLKQRHDITGGCVLRTHLKKRSNITIFTKK